MPICDGCSFAIIKLRPQEKQPVLHGDDVDVNVALPRFEPAVVHGCWICAKFSRWLETEHPELFNDWHKSQFHASYSIAGRAHVAQPKHRLLSLFMMNITAPGLDRDDDACGVDLVVVPAEEFITQPFTLPKRQLDFPVIEKWIENCKRDHTNCRGDSNPWYPTRLLHFGPRDKKLKLVISKEHSPISPYISLSHRWPPNLKFQLNSSTMSELQHGVDISTLPRVFRDSVQMAQRLGIYYLWIDALCIKQDKDLSDWKIESQNMGKVYSSAFLNISATMSSNDESDSLVQERDEGPDLPAKIELDIDGTQLDYFVINSNIWVDEIDNAPLNNRGWVFQERFSARRVLHFGRQQLGWECREVEALEMFPDGLPRTITASNISKPRIHQNLMSLSRSSEETLGRDLLMEWHVMVQNYSKCGLTKPEDKLIAFEGVAKGIMTCRGGKCIAGIWEKNIAYDLLWYRSFEGQLLFPANTTSYRAPSWSWASVDGEVDFPAFEGEIRRCFIDGGKFVEPQTSGNCILSEHPSIRVQGCCLPLKINWSKGEISSFETSRLRFSLLDTFGAEINLDGPEDEVQDLVRKARILFLPLLATSQGIHGLILAKIRGVHMHRRVGTVEIPTVKNFSHDEDPWHSPKWNMVALKLIEKIDKRQRVEIFIR